MITSSQGTLWMNPGYVVSANGEEIYIWGSAQAFTHGSECDQNNPLVSRHFLRS